MVDKRFYMFNHRGLTFVGDGQNVQGSPTPGSMPSSRQLSNIEAVFQRNFWQLAEAGAAEAKRVARVRAVIEYVDVTAAPPSSNVGDRYILDFTGGSVHAGWDGASKGDIVEMEGADGLWVTTTPEEGMVAYVDDQDVDYIYVDDGSPVWQPHGGGGGVTDHGALTGLGDDDHPQYHNDARGDLRYIQLFSEAQIKVYKQNLEPVLTAVESLAIWIDTDHPITKTHLIFRRGAGDQVKVQLH